MGIQFSKIKASKKHRTSKIKPVDCEVTILRLFLVAAIEAPKPWSRESGRPADSSDGGAGMIWPRLFGILVSGGGGGVGATAAVISTKTAPES